jgi:polysaccharide pyruvyl transferase WcaK-like protein
MPQQGQERDFTANANLAAPVDRMRAPHFLLVGNGPYSNRGCEAIVRGTTRILDAAFGSQTFYVAASFGSPAQIKAQAAYETFPRMRHEWLAPKGRISADYLKFQANRFLGVKCNLCLHRLPPDAPQCSAALQVGGDNYSLDYGFPQQFMQIDRRLERQGVPLVLWGASVGPFGKDPVCEREMTKHLSKFCLIIVRESRSYRYLQSLELKNISQVANPAFLMEPQPVTDLVLPANFLGINLSPLTAKNVTGGDVSKWCGICAAAVARMLSQCDLPVILVPHVFTPVTENDDHAFLQAVARATDSPRRVTVLGTDYTAAQLKWVIGKATVFAGARTHSTIAALSMGVPTVSLAYSVKAWGINEDVFGHTDYCMDVSELQREPALADRMSALLANKESIQCQLRSRLPAVQADAMKAGIALRDSLNARE